MARMGTALVVLTCALTGVLAVGPGAPASARPHDPVPPAADTLAATPPEASRPDVGARRAGDVRLQGRGYGHGRGMSQYGAEGAARKGLSHQRILRFYYPGTTLGRTQGTLRVFISADNTSDVVVVDRSHLAVRRVGGGHAIALKHRGARQWRITPADGNQRSTISVLTRKWHTVRTLKGDAEFLAGGRPLTLVLPDGRARYRGVLRSATPPSASGRDTVNVLPLEQYLRGVVPQEIPASWSTQAVQSQAVAARTYAAYLRQHPDTSIYDLCDTSSCQVYGGVDAEYPDSDRAVHATRHEVLRYRGKLAFTEFSASNGGWTVRGSQPYLKAQRDPYDRTSVNPYRSYTTRITRRDLQLAYPRIDRFRKIKVTKRDGHGAWGGRVLKIRITGSGGTVTTSGEAFRSTFGLRSSWFRVR